jgi:hypothetical protein
MYDAMAGAGLGVVRGGHATRAGPAFGGVAGRRDAMAGKDDAVGVGGGGVWAAARDTAAGSVLCGEKGCCC